MSVATPDLRIDVLRSSDLDDALRLSAAAGWNQIDADWTRLLHLWPATCFGGWVGDELAASGTLAVFDGDGRVGWIGMILVDAAHQRRGYGGAIFDHLLDIGRQRGVTTFALDATDDGRRVYVKRGFVDIAAIARWKRVATEVPPLSDAASAPPARNLIGDDWTWLLALDRRAVGVDRAPLLRQLAGESGATVSVANDGSAFGFSRRGRTEGHIGPIVAPTPLVTDAILAHAIRAAGGSTTDLFIDVPDNPPLEPFLAARGFSPRRLLTRMICGPKLSAACPGLCAAAAGFEVG